MPSQSPITRKPIARAAVPSSWTLLSVKRAAGDFFTRGAANAVAGSSNLNAGSFGSAIFIDLMATPGHEL